ncbi:MAG: hypothetical protein R3B06_02075 [Kofleriaceae bacterium]
MPPPKISTAAGVAALVALVALACTKSEPARSGPATTVAEPSPPAAAAAPLPACGTRATVFARADVVGTDLDLIVRSAPLDSARLGRIAADPAGYATAFRDAIIVDPPAASALAQTAPSEFVSALAEYAPPAAQALAAELVRALDRAIDCSSDPGGRTRLRDERMRAELGVLTEAELRAMIDDAQVAGAGGAP